MPNIKNWILTDVSQDLWHDPFNISSTELEGATGTWAINKSTLQGGRSDGVELIEVHNGALSFSVLPTRGMGIWRGNYKGIELGWKAPILGPVHPKYVDRHDRCGLGWLDGFDEWIVRCGLTSNGPPGQDPVAKEFVTLHGKIANTPAHYVEVQVDLEPPYEIKIIGQVDETTMFFNNLRMTSTIVTSPGSNILVVHDVIENRHSKPADLMVLYHCNFGPPILGKGSRFQAPVKELAPSTDHAADNVTHYDEFDGPTPGFAEQVYFFDLLEDEAGGTLGLLHNAGGDKGVCVRMIKPQLPRFIVWKHTAGENEGYVTGLEPATNYPNFKQTERKHHRVVSLAPHEKYTTTVIIEVLDSIEAIHEVQKEIVALQGDTNPIIHRKPQPKYSE